MLSETTKAWQDDAGKHFASCAQLAFGILYKHLTEPFWKLTESKDTHILQLGQIMQDTYSKLQEWSEDASLILHKNVPPLFPIPNSGEMILSVIDDMYGSLYSPLDYLSKLTAEAFRHIVSTSKSCFRDIIWISWKGNTVRICQIYCGLKHKTA